MDSDTTMPSESPDTTTNTTPPENKGGSKKKMIIVAAVALVVGLLIAAGVWFWQQQKVNDYTTKNEELTTQNSKLSTDLAAANTKLAEAEKELTAYKSPEQATLTISVDQAKHDGQDYTNSEGKDLLWVDLTVKNNSDVDGYFSQSSLKLKDASNNVHPLCQNSSISYSCSRGLELPAGKVELKDTTVKQGETVRGTVGFYVPKTGNEFTLLYDDKKIDVSVQ